MIELVDRNDQTRPEAGCSLPLVGLRFANHISPLEGSSLFMIALTVGKYCLPILPSPLTRLSTDRLVLSRFARASFVSSRSNSRLYDSTALESISPIVLPLAGGHGLEFRMSFGGDSDYLCLQETDHHLVN